MTVPNERPDLDDIRAFYGPESYTTVIAVNTTIGSGSAGEIVSPKHRVILAARELFEEAVGGALSELAASYGGEFDFSGEEGRGEFLRAIQAGGSLALIELRGPEHNTDFFTALAGE